MDDITKEDFIQWKTERVTKAVFDTIKERIEDAKEILAAQAGIDDRNDRFLAGTIHAFREILDIDYSE